MHFPVWAVQVAARVAGRPMLGWLIRWAQAPVLTIGPLREAGGCPPEWADLDARIENPSETVTVRFPGPWRFEGTPNKAVPPRALATVEVVGYELQKEITPGGFRSHALRVRFDSVEEKDAVSGLFYRVRVTDVRGIECEGWYPKKP